MEKPKRKKRTDHISLRRRSSRMKPRRAEQSPHHDVAGPFVGASPSVAECAWWERCDLAVVYGLPPDLDDLRMADALVADLAPSANPVLTSVACLLALHFRRCLAIASWRYFDVAFFAAAHLTANFEGSDDEVDEVLVGLGHFFEWLTLHGVVEPRDLATLRLNVEAAREPDESGGCRLYANAVPPGTREQEAAA